MAVAPQKFRELVFQILYSYDISGEEDDAIVPLLVKELAVSKKTVLQAQERARAILRQKAEIDARITRISRAYEFARIQTVERNVLRLGVFELALEKVQPPKVVIAEAMRLCRKFTSPEAASFVNAILDALYKETQGEAPAVDRLLEAAEALADSERRDREAAEAKRQEQDELPA
jgi:N utilization substance protein B